jgi:hypothetical protein
MSAQRASPDATDATNPPAIPHVRIPGSSRTYEVRDVLRGMGLRWDPLSRVWHVMLPGDQGSRLVRNLGLKPQIVPTIEAFAAEVAAEPARCSPGQPEPPRIPSPIPSAHDGSRTRVEARLAFPGGMTTPKKSRSVIAGLASWSSRAASPTTPGRRTSESRIEVSATCVPASSS